MQAQNPSSSAVEASTPPNIKRYLVKETWKEYQVTLEVNHDVLTEETASLINGFWSNAEDRLNCDGCGRFLSERQRFDDCPNCGARNAP